MRFGLFLVTTFANKTALLCLYTQYILQQLLYILRVVIVIDFTGSVAVFFSCVGTYNKLDAFSLSTWIIFSISTENYTLSIRS